MTPEVNEPPGSADPEVIVVEDDVHLARMLAYALETAELTVQVYNDGTSALEAILALPRSTRVRLLLLDVDLPGLDGHSLHERVRAERPGEFVAAFLSARESEADQLRALGTGAIDFLAKPVPIAVLRAKVRNWVAALRKHV